MLFFEENHDIFKKEVPTNREKEQIMLKKLLKAILSALRCLVDPEHFKELTEQAKKPEQKTEEKK